MSSSFTQGRRAGFSRPLALALLLAIALTALLPAPAQATPPRTVTVEDTVGVIATDELTAQVEAVDFRRPIDLHVLVLDVRENGFSRSDDRALNDATLAHARDEAPQLLSTDGRTWADGLVILALDPAGRFLGAYAGEDVKLTDSGLEAVVDAMRDDAADGEWSQAIIAGAQKYASLLDRPWWRHPVSLILAALAFGAAILWVWNLLSARRSARRQVDDALPRLQDVLIKQQLTDAVARTLPADSPYAQAALADHGKFSQKVRQAQTLRDEIPWSSERRWGWGLRQPQRILARSFASTVQFLDDTDDDIIATNDLLHRIGDWEAAWERELEPLRDSLAAVDEVIAEVDDAGDEESWHERDAALAELRSLGADVSAEMDALTEQLRGDAIAPEAALEQLDDLTEQLGAAVSRLREEQILGLAEDESEEEVLRSDDLLPDDATELRYRSVRARRYALEGAGFAGATGPWNISPVLWYSLWNQQATSGLETYRSPGARSTGSVSGYSPATSGGFSGAGVSGRF